MSDPVRSWDAGLQARLDALVKRADGGDRAVLPAVKQIFDAVPGVWDAYGDLATIAESTLIDLLAGASALTREALRKRLAAMRAELAGSEASLLHRLLVPGVA